MTFNLYYQDLRPNMLFLSQNIFSFHLYNWYELGNFVKYSFKNVLNSRQLNKNKVYNFKRKKFINENDTSFYTNML